MQLLHLLEENSIEKQRSYSSFNYYTTAHLLNSQSVNESDLTRSMVRVSSSSQLFSNVL